MKRKSWVVIGAAGLVVVIVTGSVLVTLSTTRATPTAQGKPANTATVKKETLSAMVLLNGTLTYQAGADGSPYFVINQSSGTYTELPQLGQVVSQGQVLYRVDDSPVVLLYGATPCYRTLSPGATGTDVAELNADLVALGYATPTQLDPTSVAFEPATTTALEKLQAALGMAQSGTLGLGQAVFEPTAVRVTTLSARLGGTTQPGQTVMQATSTMRQVEAALDASHQSEVTVGDKATITLPDNETLPGVVSSVGTVATCPSSSPTSGSSASSPGPPTDSCPAGSPGTSATPTVTVDVTPSNPTATGTWDQAPVQVTVTTGSVPSALVVPVTALLARSGGGYAVEVVAPSGTHHLVPVSLGLFDDADGLVQVTGTRLTAGQEVVVPSI